MFPLSFVKGIGNSAFAQQLVRFYFWCRILGRKYWQLELKFKSNCEGEYEDNTNNLFLATISLSSLSNHTNCRSIFCKSIGETGRGSFSL
jgi:hypothetical protein